MKALIAEDDFINRRVMQLFLAGFGKCDVADNGRTALNMYQEASRNRKPYSLVCLDSSLPEMDGQTLLQEIRRYEKEQSILGRDGARIMFISSDTRKETILAAFRGQCDGFMLKPFRKRELIHFLHEQELVNE